MATKHPQREDKVATVKAVAASSSSVPQLRDEVVRLAEAVEELQSTVARLTEMAQ